MVYPEYSEKSDIINCKSETFKKKIKDLWDKLPKFRDSRSSVPVFHVPNKKALIRHALEDKDFMVQTAAEAMDYYYKC